MSKTNKQQPDENLAISDEDRVNEKATESKTPKIIILDDNPYSISRYLDEYGDTLDLQAQQKAKS